MGQASRRRAGLTLIEVLIAVALVGTALAVLLTAAGRCLAVMKASRHYQTAQWTLNRGELENPLIVSNDVAEMAVAPVAYPNGYTYSREVDEEAADRDDHLYVVRSRVTWSSRGTELKQEVVRYVYVPTNAIR